MISNVGPVGCIPYQRILNELNDEDCVDLANNLATKYNSRLKDLVAELNGNLPGATFVLANVYDLVSELIVNYKKYGNNLVFKVFTQEINYYALFAFYLINKHVYNICFAGFTTASRACCGIGIGGQVAGVIPCVPTSSLCSDREKHVFWDQYHPSEAANVILAKQLINGDKKYISPINLRQLIDL